MLCSLFVSANVLGHPIPDTDVLTSTVWQSSEALSDFLESPRCAPVLQSMGLADASPFRHSLQWESCFSLGEETFSDELYGRLTLTILSLDRPRQEARRSIVDAFGGFFPKGCRDFLDRPPWYPDAITWLEDTAAGDHPQVTSICYYFYRWNGDRSSTEREEVAIREPGARETWEGAVAKASPPTVSWEQQRWDVAVAPYQMRH